MEECGMNKYLIATIGLVLALLPCTVSAQDYPIKNSYQHYYYTDEWDFIDNGIYYHIIPDTETPELAVMNDNELFNYCGSWVLTWPNEVLYHWKLGYYSGDIIVPEKVLHDGVEYTVTKISFAAFAGCPELTSVTLPSTIREIRPGAFMQCENMKDLPKMPDGTKIYWETFFNCSSLKVADLRNCSEVEEWAFENCKGLETIILPENSEYFAFETVLRCESLKSIFALNKIPASMEYVNERDVPFFPQITLYVPEGSEELYRNAKGWSQFKNIKAGTYAGTETTEIASGTAVRVEGGRIIVESADGATMPIEVYNTAGQKVRSLNAGGTAEIALPSGLYIVRAGTSVVKVAI